jgi:hypothetical protein
MIIVFSNNAVQELDQYGSATREGRLSGKIFVGTILLGAFAGGVFGALTD